MYFTQITRIVFTMLVALAFAALPGLTRAEYPDRPISLVVPYPPGGTADIVGRLVALELGLKLKQSIVVQNRGGAAGNIGAQMVKAAAPDGYTLILGNAPVLTINPHLFAQPGFDPFKDFEPIAPVAETPLFLIAHPSAPYKTVQEFVDWSKKNPGKATYASGSTGSTTNLAMIRFMKEADFRSLHVPYKGSGPALAALAAGEVPVMFELLPSAMGLMKDKMVKPLAVTSPKRQSNYPDVPTIAESGFPGFDVSSWFGVLAPAGTPKPVLDKLSTALAEVMAASHLRTRLVELGAVPMTGTRQEFARLIKEEHGRWATAVKSSGAKAE